MRKIFKKAISVLMVLIIAASFIPMSTFTASAATSGYCGDKVKWSFNSSTGALSITGTGDMYDYNDYYYSNTSPWTEHRSNIKSVTVGSGVTSIGNYAFGFTYSYNRYSNLSSVTLSSTVTKIGACAFYYCDKLTSITIPGSVTTIGNYAFEKSGLTSISIPDSVTTIGNSAFFCSNLKTVTIGKGLKSLSLSAFTGCPKLTSITVSSSNSYYSSDGYGVLFNKNKTELLIYPYGNTRTSYIIPDTVTSIYSYAFTATSSGYSYAFEGCANLKRLSVSANNTAFSTDKYGVLFNKDKTTLVRYLSACDETSYVIPDTVTTIGNQAFYQCKNLADVTIGKKRNNNRQLRVL